MNKKNENGHVEGEPEKLPEAEFEPVSEEPIPTQTERPVPYAPVPMAFHISQSLGTKGILVCLSIQTAEGDKVFFLDAEIGKELGDALIKMSEASAQGIVYKE